MPSVFRWFSDLIASLPDWQQNVIASVVVAALLGTYPLCRSLVSRVKARRERLRSGREAAAQAEQEMVAEFERFPAERGIYNHSKNLSSSLKACVELTHRIVPVILDIQRFIVETAKAFPDKSNPDYIDRKGEMISKAARSLHGRITELERLAGDFESNIALFAESLRGLQVLPVNSDTDRETLRSIRNTFTGKFAEAFALGVKAIEQQRVGMKALYGLDQDMNRIAVRYSQALAKVRDANARMNAFCTDELVATVAKKLGEVSEPVTLTRPSAAQQPVGPKGSRSRKARRR